MKISLTTTIGVEFEKFSDGLNYFFQLSIFTGLAEGQLYQLNMIDCCIRLAANYHIINKILQKTNYQFYQF